MIHRLDVQIATGEQMLGGWLFEPPGRLDKAPGISMAPGFAAIKEQHLEQFAHAFAEAGFVVLLHDHRNFGASDGALRHDIDPLQQIEDWQHAVSFLASLPGVDAGRIGLWGTGFSAGHAMVLSSIDRRVGAVVAQTPTISGYQAHRRHHGYGVSEQLPSAHGLARMPIVSCGRSKGAYYQTPGANEFFSPALFSPVWSNEITVRSAQRAQLYEPGVWIARVGPTPLLLVVADDDQVEWTDAMLEAYEHALQPKKLLLVKGGHYAPFFDRFPHASRAAVQWFQEHLALSAGQRARRVRSLRTGG